MLNEGVLFKRKCINAVKHTNEVYQRRLNQLMMEYQRLKSESSSSKVSSDACTQKKKDDAMVITSLTPQKSNFLGITFCCLLCSFADLYKMTDHRSR